MKVIIEQSAGKDYPANLKDDPALFEKQKESLRRRLELRPEDEIEIREVGALDLDGCWALLKAAEKGMLDLNRPWESELGGHGSLIYEYKIEEILTEAKSSLVHLAVKQILAKHNIQNVTIPEEVLNQLIWHVEGFSTQAIEEAIKQPYIADADTEACRQLMSAAHHVIPYLGFDKKATVQDIAKGKRLTLRIRWSYGWVDSSSYDDLYAFQVLLKAHMENIPSSKCTLGHKSLGQMIESFRDSNQSFNQARSYVYEDGTIDAFRVYKNGHVEIAFKHECDAETAAKILLEQPLTPALNASCSLGLSQ